jgi:hypothetical protein
MVARILGTLLLASSLTFGLIGWAHAGGNGQGQNQNQNGGGGYLGAPELDPNLGLGAIVLLGGSLLLLSERRRSENK